MPPAGLARYSTPHQTRRATPLCRPCTINSPTHLPPFVVTASVAEEPSAAAASTQAQAGAGGGVAGAAPAAAEAGPGFDLNLYRAPDKVAAWARGNNGKPDGSKAASGGSEALTALEAERRRMSPDSAGTGGGAGGGSGANIQPGGVRTGMRGGGYAKRSGGAGAAPASTRRKSKAQRSSGYAERHSPRKGFRGGPPGGAAAAGSQRQVVDLGSSYTTLTADEVRVWCGVGEEPPSVECGTC